MSVWRRDGQCDKFWLESGDLKANGDFEILVKCAETFVKPKNISKIMYKVCTISRKLEGSFLTEKIDNFRWLFSPLLW